MLFRSRSVRVIDRPRAEQSTLYVGRSVPDPTQPDYVALEVTNSLLAGSFHSRVTMNLREDKGYTYSPDSDVSLTPEQALWTFQADVTTEHTGDSLKEVFKEIRRMQTEPVPGEEAKGIRTYMAGLFAIMNSTSGAVIGTLATRDLLGLPADWTERYVPAVLAVTPEQMMAFAKRGYPLDKLTLIVVGDLKTVVPQLKALPELANVPMTTITVP